MRDVHHAQLLRLIADAMERGCTQSSPAGWTWDLSGPCSSPHTVSLRGRRAAHEATGYRAGRFGRNLAPFVAGGRIPATIYLDVLSRCRRCDACLRHRTKLWAARARTECFRSARTWFGTLTLRPEEHSKSVWIGGSEAFADRHKAIGIWLTWYLDRIRKESKSRFRYLLVAEKHKSGLPHYHLLLHETREDQPVTHRILSKQWTHGFEKWRLLKREDDRAAWYVCKYLSKSLEARVRASKRYGQEFVLSAPQGIANGSAACIGVTQSSLGPAAAGSGERSEGAPGNISEDTNLVSAAGEKKTRFDLQPSSQLPSTDGRNEALELAFERISSLLQESRAAKWRRP